MRTRTALAGVAAGAAWLSFADDGLPARAAVGAVLVLLPVVTLAGHLRAPGPRARGSVVLPVVAAAVTALALAGEDLGLPLGVEGGPALVALALALWTALLLRRPTPATRPRTAPLPAPLAAPVVPAVPVVPVVPVVSAPLTATDVPASQPVSQPVSQPEVPVAQARR